MKRKWKLMLFVPAVIAAAILFGRYAMQRLDPDPGIIRVSGNMEVTDIELSFRIPGWIQERPISEGQQMEAGEVIALQDPTELAQQVELRSHEVAAAAAALAELEAGSRPEEIAAFEAAVAQAQARLQELQAGSRPEEIAAAAAQVAATEADRELKAAELARVRRLHAGGTATDQEMEAAQTAYRVAQARLQEASQRLRLLELGARVEQIAQAESALAESSQRLALVREGPRRETVEQARWRLRQAQQSLEIARTRLAYTRLTSPVSGMVLSENVQAGEYVAAGTPIVTVADLRDIWLRAYIEQPDLGRVKVGQAVRVRTDTYPDRLYDGRVSFISSQAEFTPKTVQTQRERVRLVYRIKIVVNNPDMELKPGMPADAEIILDS